MLFSRFTRSIETILIVEDEPLVAFDNELRVVDAGYRVVATVDTEAEAIAVLFATGTCPGHAKQYAIGCLIKPYSAAELVKAIHAVDLLIRGQTPKAMPKPLNLYSAA